MAVDLCSPAISVHACKRPCVPRMRSFIHACAQVVKSTSDDCLRCEAQPDTCNLPPAAALLLPPPPSKQPPTPRPPPSVASQPPPRMAQPPAAIARSPSPATTRTPASRPPPLRSRASPPSKLPPAMRPGPAPKPPSVELLVTFEAGKCIALHAWAATYMHRGTHCSAACMHGGQGQPRPVWQGRAGLTGKRAAPALNDACTNDELLQVGRTARCCAASGMAHRWAQRVTVRTLLCMCVHVCAGRPANPTSAQRAVLMPLLREAVKALARSALSKQAAPVQHQVRVASGSSAGAPMQLRVTVQGSGRGAAVAVGNAVVRAVGSGELASQVARADSSSAKPLLPKGLRLKAARFTITAPR